jgi:hypothetical protein
VRRYAAEDDDTFTVTPPDAAHRPMVVPRQQVISLHAIDEVRRKVVHGVPVPAGCGHADDDVANGTVKTGGRGYEYLGGQLV